MRRIISTIKHDIKLILKNKNQELSKDIEEVIKQLNQNGIIIIRSFLKSPKIYIKKIDNLIDHPLCWKDEKGSDHRLNGIDKFDKDFSKIFKNDFLREIYSNYLGEIKESYVMANKVLYKDNNLGSGQGWHKDNIARQLKFMIYLNDVNKDNGPFQYLLKSHKIDKKLKIDIKENKLIHNSNRIININPYLEKFKLFEANANAGDLIIFDSSGIHRGKPIKSGERYALTLYSNKNKFSKETKQKWLSQ